MQHGRQWVSNIQRAGRRYRFQVGGLPDRDGTTTRWHSFDTQEEAEKARRQVLAGIRRLQQAAEALTWAEAIDQYCTARAEECRALSIGTLRGRLRRFFHDALQPAKLTADQAQALYNTLRPKVSVQEHRHCLSRARALGAWLVSQGMWKDNPLAVVKPVGRPNRGKPQLTRDEARTLMRWCLIQNADEGAAATLTLLLLGLRASELCGLTIRDLDDGGTLLHVRGTKTAAAKRTLGVPYPTRDAPDVPDLRSLLLRQAERARRRPTKPQGEMVSISPPLWGRDRWWVHREVTRCCKAAGVPLVPPHGLRGTWASLARAVATAPVAVAATLGQAGTEVQERHYARPDAIAAGHQVAVLQVIRGGTR